MRSNTARSTCPHITKLLRLSSVAIANDIAKLPELVQRPHNAPNKKAPTIHSRRGEGSKLPNIADSQTSSAAGPSSFPFLKCSERYPPGQARLTQPSCMGGSCGAVQLQ
jgi:hypothetical protein